MDAAEFCVVLELLVADGVEPVDVWVWEGMCARASGAWIQKDPASRTASLPSTLSHDPPPYDAGMVLGDTLQVGVVLVALNNATMPSFVNTVSNSVGFEHGLINDDGWVSKWCGC